MEEEIRRSIEKAARVDPKAEITERVARAQAKVREMFGGKPPRGVVDAFLAERRAAAERGE